MNQRNDDGYQSGRYSQASGEQRESPRQSRTRQNYEEQSDRSRMQQTQAGRNRGEYYGGEQFGERAQTAGWNEDRNWEYEGGPERYNASGYAEPGNLTRQQSGRYRGAQSQYGGRREYGSQNTGASDYYSGRQGYAAQESFGSDYNTYGRNQGFGEGSGYTRSQQSLGGQQGRSFAQQPRGYGGGSLYGGESAGSGGRNSLYGSQDYLDDGEMSGYRGSGSSRYGTAPGQYGYGGIGTRAGYRGVGPKNYTRSDDRLTEDINERLTDDDDLDASDITVRVSDGKVTLEGSVDQRWMKHRAEDIADACIGVKEVDNRIQVTSASSVLGQRATDTRATSPSRSPQAGTTATGSSTTGGTTPH